MQLSDRTLSNLAVMICGDKDIKYGKNFPYRSSSRLTAFFTNCDLPHAHDGTTRKYWVGGVLQALNGDIASHPDLPSDSLVTVVCELMNEDYFDVGENSLRDRQSALHDLNSVLARESLVAFPRGLTRPPRGVRVLRREGRGRGGRGRW